MTKKLCIFKVQKMGQILCVKKVPFRKSGHIYNTYGTGFAKRGLPYTSNLPTLTIDNFRMERAIALKFGQW